MLTKAVQMIRSLFFSASMMVITIFYSFICILAKPLPAYYRHKLISAWTSLIIWLLKVICGVKYHIQGSEHIPKDRNGVILSKHQSTWETFFLQSYFKDPAIILKRELLWVPFFGWGLSIIDPIAINRKDKLSAMDQIIKQGTACLNKGRWILVFPEGTRIPPGEVGKYRPGGARLAVETGSPILPIAHNAGRFWPKRGFLKKPGTIQVVIGPLIETKGRDALEVLTEAKHWIEETMLKIDS